MGPRPCCRSCRHCTPPHGEHLGWCHLRQLGIHADLVAELWCHHWTQRPPRLPLMATAPPAGRSLGCANQQLSLESALDTNPAPSS